MNDSRHKVIKTLIAACALAMMQRPVESGSAAPSGTWKTLRPMSVPAIFAPAVVGSDGRIYVFGGLANYDSTNPLANTRVYDPRTDMWSEGARMPTPRACPGAALGPDGKIYVIGGEVTHNALDTVEAYDSKNNTWSPRRPMPTARSGPSIVPARGADGRVLFYAIGGRDFRTPGNGLHTTEAYDPAKDTWLTMAPMPTHRHAQTEAKGADGLIYIIGGANKDHREFLNSVEVYDPVKRVWSTTESLPYPVECAMAISTPGLGGEVLVCGGWRTPEKVETRAAVAYRPRTKTWRSLLDLPTARAAGAAVLIQTPDGTAHIYIIGGKGTETMLEEYSFRPAESSK